MGRITIRQGGIVKRMTCMTSSPGIDVECSIGMLTSTDLGVVYRNCVRLADVLIFDDYLDLHEWRHPFPG